jgi:hypothetical protein
MKWLSKDDKSWWLGGLGVLIVALGLVWIHPGLLLILIGGLIIAGAATWNRSILKLKQEEKIEK